MEGFIAFLDGRIAEGKAEISALEADSRKDEANFARVKVNIFDICKTVTLTLANRPGAGTEAVTAQFERFRAAWGGALEKARRHGNADGAAVEEIKLAALEEVVARFREVTGA